MTLFRYLSRYKLHNVTDLRFGSQGTEVDVQVRLCIVHFTDGEPVAVFRIS